MSLQDKLTGSTGNPIQDGVARGTIATAAVALLVFVSDKVDFITADDVGTLTPVVVGLSFLIAGLYDRFIRA